MIFKAKISKTPMTSTALLAVILCGYAQAQNTNAPATPIADARAGWFPFVIPTLANKQTSGSALDLSFLSPKAAGADGFLRAQGEKIVDGTGREVRLFGTNITDYAVMPPKETAPSIARRLRELGVNFVRLHYYDWATAPDGILNADRQTLNAQKLDQMDWLIYQLKQNGVYVDINLHTARGYADLPQGWDWMGKTIDRLHPAMIESQKQFARDLLTHVNPYTRTAYTSEPAVAVVEINNENTALQPDDNTAFQMAALPEVSIAPIRVLWNNWLRAKYGSTAQLKASWDGDLPAIGPQLIGNGDFGAGTRNWQVQAGGGAQATSQTVTEDGQTFLRWNATKAGAEHYNLQLHQFDVAVKKAEQIGIKLRARADQNREVQVRLMNNAEPWASVSPVLTLDLTTQWKEFEIYGPINNPNEITVRLSFDALNTPGVYDLDDVSVRIEGKAGVLDGTSLEDNTIPLVGASSNARARTDYVDFLAARERESSGEIMRFLRDDLKVKSLIWDTQVNYGGARGLARELAIGSDAIDIHEYSSHPSGTRDEGGKWTWITQRKSLLGAAFESLPSLSQWRVTGKPFFVSEYDLNPPNDYASETLPLLAAAAAYQGWSGFAEYAWLNFNGGQYNPDSIRSPFQTAGHAGQVAWMPISALLLRQGLIQQAHTRLTLGVAEPTLRDGVLHGAAMSQMWDPVGVTRTEGWRQSLAVNIEPVGAPTLHGTARASGAQGDDKIVVSDTDQIRFDRLTAGAETMTVNAPALRMAFGQTGGKTFDLGDATISVERGTLNGYANIGVVALDGLPLAQSKKVLVIAVARVENKGMKYNAERTSVGQDFGQGPTLAEPVQFSVRVPGNRWRATALDGNGRKAGALKMQDATLRVSQPSSLWYLLER